MSAPSFDSITSLPPRDRLPAYLALLPDLYQSPLPGLPDLVIHLVSDPAVSLVVARQVYAEIVAALGDNRITDEDAKRVALEKILEKISDMSGGAQANFEEQVGLRCSLWSLSDRSIMFVRIWTDHSLPVPSTDDRAQAAAG